MNDLRFGRAKCTNLYGLYANLITEARAAAKKRGHKMGNAMLIRHYSATNDRTHKMTGSATCKTCGATFSVTTKPDPNDTWITGNAVATNCHFGSKV